MGRGNVAPSTRRLSFCRVTGTDNVTSVLLLLLLALTVLVELRIYQRGAL